MCYPPPVTGSRRRPLTASQRACRPGGWPPHAVQLSEHGRDRRRPSGRAPESLASRAVQAGARRARGPGRPAVRGRASVVRPAEEVLRRRAGAWRRAGRRREEARPGRRAEPCGGPQGRTARRLERGGAGGRRCGRGWPAMWGGQGGFFFFLYLGGGLRRTFVW
jgi:hypothetical protein